MKDELVRRLKERMADEYADVHTYHDLVHKAKELGDDFAAWYLERIMHDEKTHAEALKEVVEEMEKD